MGSGEEQRKEGVSTPKRNFPIKKKDFKGLREVFESSIIYCILFFCGFLLSWENLLPIYDKEERRNCRRNDEGFKRKRGGHRAAEPWEGRKDSGGGEGCGGSSLKQQKWAARGSPEHKLWTG